MPHVPRIWGHGKPRILAVPFFALPAFPGLPSSCKTLQKRYNSRMQWSVGFLDEETKAALDALPIDIRASFQRIVELIQAHGLERIREPYLKHLEGPLWEMRLKGKSGIARAVYVTATGMRIVVVHIFVKKTQKTPKKEIAKALKKAKEVE